MIAIAIPPDERAAAAVLQRGRNIALQLGTAWIAIFVARSATAVAHMRDVVAALGGQLVASEAHDVVSAVIDLSLREDAQLLVIGRSRRPRIVRRLMKGTTEQILRARRPFDVVVART